MSKTTKQFILIASIMMALNIAIGAFGAHGLKPYLNEYSTLIYNKAVSYSFYNTLGLFAIAFISTLMKESSKISTAFYSVFIGTIIFSFSLYILALSKIMWLGAITPIGGTLMIIGWIMVAVKVYKE